MWRAFAAIAGLLTIIAVIAVGWWAFGSLAGLVNAATKAQRAAAVAQVQAAQASSDAAAQRLADANTARQHVDFTVHQEASHAIAVAPGANQPVDPAGVLALHDGVCGLSQYRASGVCGPLRPTDSTQRPSANAAAGPS